MSCQYSVDRFVGALYGRGIFRFVYGGFNRLGWLFRLGAFSFWFRVVLGFQRCKGRSFKCVDKNYSVSGQTGACQVGCKPRICERQNHGVKRCWF